MIVRHQARPGVGRLVTSAIGRRLDVLILVLAYTALYSSFSIRRHEALKSTAFDLALFDNILWNTAHGHQFESWMPPFAMGNYLADHLSPIMLALAVPYVIYHDPRILLVLQSAILALGAVPVASLATRRLESRLAGAFFALAYLAYPFVGFLNLWDFHQEAVLVTALLFAFDFADRRRFGPTLACLAIAIATKEEAALAVSAFGLYLLVRHRAPLVGLGVAVLGAMYFVAAVEVIIPAFRRDLPFVYADRYGHLGETPFDVVLGLVRSPAHVVPLILDHARVDYLRDLFFPLPLALLGPGALLTGVPILMGNLLSSLPQQHSIEHHYAAGIAPGIVVASIEGAGLVTRLVVGLSQRLRLPRPAPGRVGAVVALLSLAGCLGASVSSNPIQRASEQGWLDVDPDKTRALARIATAVPSDASLAASWTAAPHFAGRRVLTPFPVPLVRTEYALVDLTEVYLSTYPGEIHDGLRQLESDGYVRIADEEPFVLYRRRWQGDPPPLTRGAVGRGGASARGDVTYGNVLTLLDVRTESATDGRRAAVGLRWRVDRSTAEHFGVRLRLVSRHGEPLLDWWNGLVPRVTPWLSNQDGLVWDRYYFDVPADVAGLVSVHLAVEPFRWPQREFLTPSEGSTPPVIRLRVASPFDGGAGESAAARFGQLASLERFVLERHAAVTGRPIEGALRFRALATTDNEYTVSVQLVGDDGLLVQDDALPNRAYAPTTSWRVGDPIDHRFALAVPPDAAPGLYRVIVILYDQATGERLPVGHEDVAELGTIEIR